MITKLIPEDRIMAAMQTMSRGDVFPVCFCDQGAVVMEC